MVFSNGACLKGGGVYKTQASVTVLYIKFRERWGGGGGGWGGGGGNTGYFNNLLKSNKCLYFILFV